MGDPLTLVVALLWVVLILGAAYLAVRLVWAVLVTLYLVAAYRVRFALAERRKAHR